VSVANTTPNTGETNMLVYRIQPAGLGLNHNSEDSNGDCLHLHVFDSAYAAIHCEECPTVYGDEVVEIEVDRVWDNGDVEGVACNGTNATIVRRFTLDDFAKFAVPAVAELVAEEIDCSMAYVSCPFWSAAREQ